ncbi:hypothetical protein PR002_g30529 [Phytophthora rubi]|uniref:Uncharacterized protein n=1 Tax=Phytophthora rubi TaxID=129364 RepID=A0A6A3GPD5_9STRA|nr:hypothetical protein PR002_g30529 [Phytophthora rubi]
MSTATTLALGLLSPAPSSTREPQLGRLTPVDQTCNPRPGRPAPDLPHTTGCTKRTPEVWRR